nr:unnamed protein product [Callosobruchus chinensis]
MKVAFDLVAYDLLLEKLDLSGIRGLPLRTREISGASLHLSSPGYVPSIILTPNKSLTRESRQISAPTKYKYTDVEHSFLFAELNRISMSRSIYIGIPNLKSFSHKRWLTEKADWNKFSGSVFTLTLPEDVNAAVDLITKAIKGAAKDSIPMTSGTTSNKAVHGGTIPSRMQSGKRNPP